MGTTRLEPLVVVKRASAADPWRSRIAVEVLSRAETVCFVTVKAACYDSEEACEFNKEPEPAGRCGNGNAHAVFEFVAGRVGVGEDCRVGCYADDAE